MSQIKYEFKFKNQAKNLAKSQMSISECARFKLAANTKVPKDKCDWTKIKGTTIKPCKSYNTGFICNKENNLFAVDLDFYSKKNSKYDPINNPKHKQFIDTFGEDYIQSFDTYTQKTTNGGIHLLFQHDDNLKQTENLDYKIDTRGGDTNGYVVSAGSIVNGKKYEVINDTDIKSIPPALAEFLVKYVYKNKSNNPYTRAKKSTKNLKSSRFDYATKYKYKIDDTQLRDMLNKLHDSNPEYFTDFGRWRVFTSAMKQINKKNIWDEFSKKFGGGSYDKDGNFRKWNENDGDNKECYFFEHLCRVSKSKEILRYSRWLPIPKNTFKDFKKIDVDYISNGMSLDINKHSVIKSDTGTGKTTLFKRFIKENQYKFVSITSRRTLAEEQYYDFMKVCDGDVNYYEHGIHSDEGQGLTICLDSILKIADWDFTERIVFLDEFNSIIEYLIETNTCEKIRDDIFDVLFNKILYEAKMIIGVDADISDLSIDYLKAVELSRNIKFDYIENTHIHNKDTPVEEMDYHGIISKMTTEPLWICCTDSKRVAKMIYQDIINDDKENGNSAEPPILIVAEEKDKEEFIRLNEHKRIIFSPKIVYGLDSNGYGVNSETRPVFCVYEGQTISPSAMLQQINRERKITKLYFTFVKKNISNDVIVSEIRFKEHVADENKLALALFEQQDTANNILFCKLLYYHEYKQNCYKSNVYLHFLKLLKKRGFIVGEHTKRMEGEVITAYNKKKKDNNIQYNEKYGWKDYLKSPMNEKVLGIFNTKVMRADGVAIDSGVGKGYVPLAISDVINKAEIYEKYRNIKHLFNFDIDALSKKSAEFNDFGIKKLKSDLYQIKYAKEILAEFGYDCHLNKLIGCDNIMTQERNDTIVKKYKTIFRSRGNIPLLKNDFEIQSFILRNIYKKLSIPTHEYRVMFEGKKRTEYSLNIEQVKEFQQLIDFALRNNKIIDVADMPKRSRKEEIYYDEMLEEIKGNFLLDKHAEAVSGVDIKKYSFYGNSCKTLSWLINNSTVIEISKLFNDGKITDEQYQHILDKK